MGAEGIPVYESSSEARELHRIVQASVRECLEACRLQRQAGPVTVEALEQILARSTVPILRVLEDKPPELALLLVPSVVRTMLAAFLAVERAGSDGLRG